MRQRIPSQPRNLRRRHAIVRRMPLRQPLNLSLIARQQPTQVRPIRKRQTRLQQLQRRLQCRVNRAAHSRAAAPGKPRPLIVRLTLLVLNIPPSLLPRRVARHPRSRNRQRRGALVNRGIPPRLPSVYLIRQRRFRIIRRRNAHRQRTQIHFAVRQPIHPLNPPRYHLIVRLRVGPLFNRYPVMQTDIQIVPGPRCRHIRKPRSLRLRMPLFIRIQGVIPRRPKVFRERNLHAFVALIKLNRRPAARSAARAVKPQQDHNRKLQPL